MARQYFWHCPACGKWETYPPRRSEETEVLVKASMQDLM